MDYFTKWPEVYMYSIPNQDILMMVQILATRFFWCFRIPKDVHSNQG